MSNKQETNTGLRKELGLFHSVSIVGGIMIGSGIFYVSTYVLSRSGLSAGFAVLAWVIAGLMSLMAALCYAELVLPCRRLAVHTTTSPKPMDRE